MRKRNKQKSRTIRPDLILEKDVEKEIRKALKMAQVWHWKHWGGGFNPRGIPDILGIYPARVDDLVKAGVEEIGVFLGIEVKKPGQTPNKDQEDWIKNIVKNHGIGFWTDNVHVVIKRLGLLEKAHPLFERVLKNEESGRDRE